MKQIWPDYSYSPTTNVLTLTGLNIDRDQLLLVSAPERGRIMYNFADSAVTASAFTAGANTALTLVATTAGLTTTASLVIYYDDQLQSTSVSISNFPATQPVSIASVTIGNSVTIGSLPAISGTVTANGQAVGSTLANVFPIGVDTQFSGVRSVTDLIGYRLPISLGDSNTVVSASLSDPLPTGTNRIGVVTIGAGTVTIGAGTAQIGSVTASISGTVPVSISSVTVGNSVTIGSLPAISGTVTVGASSVTFNSNVAKRPDGSWHSLSVESGSNYVNARVFSPTVETFQATVTVGNSVTIGSIPAISGTVTVGAVSTTVTIAHHQGTSVTTSNFTSTTASTTLASANASREVLTIFSEGPGLLFVCPGATCTTVQYQVRLSAGDYYEVPLNQTSLTHSAVFATAGTARVTQIS